MHLLKALRNQAAKMKADLEDSKLFAQMGDRGTYREAIIRNFLRPFLPDCYGLSPGEVFSADGRQSAQVDVVIYDTVFSAVLFKNGPQQLFPAESVYGAVEVKSDLTSAELERACENSRRLKELPRPASDMLDFTPLVRFNVDEKIFSYEKRPFNPYVTSAFGFHGPSAETIAVSLNRKVASDQANKHLLPDFIFVADPGYMVTRSRSPQSGGGFASPGQEFNQYMFLETGADALPLFFLTLNIYLGQIRLRTVDYAALWGALFNQILTEKANKKL
jgi:uncharacterized protein DUF6602